MKAAVEKNESLHIYPPSMGHLQPLPVTFYLTEEIMADDGISDERLADLLKGDVEFAIRFYRDKFRASVTQS